MNDYNIVRVNGVTSKAGLQGDPKK